jgi:hypothetical protein
MQEEGSFVGKDDFIGTPARGKNKSFRSLYCDISKLAVISSASIPPNQPVSLTHQKDW